jgi:heme exporter protein D
MAFRFGGTLCEDWCWLAFGVLVISLVDNILRPILAAPNA